MLEEAAKTLYIYAMIHLLPLKRLFISLFLLLNVSAIIYSNWPPRLVPYSRQGSHFPRMTRFLGDYAYLTGTCLIAKMFSSPGRYDSRTLIWAIGPQGQRRLLPLPTQSRRSLIQSIFVDTKEYKYLENLNQGPPLEGRRLLSAYLCREYGTPLQPIAHILFETEREIPSRIPKKTEFPIADIPCPPSFTPR